MKKKKERGRARDREGGGRENCKCGDGHEDLSLMRSVHTVCKSVVLLLIVEGSPTLPKWLGGKDSACNAGDRVQPLGWEHLLEEGMATHSSILAWRIPWTEKPGRLRKESETI